VCGWSFWAISSVEAYLAWVGKGTRLELIREFCYLGNTIGAGGGAEEASRARVRSASAKFRELTPVLPSRELA